MKKCILFLISLFFTLFVFTIDNWGEKITSPLSAATEVVADVYAPAPIPAITPAPAPASVVITSPEKDASLGTATGFTVTVDASHPSGFDWMRLWVDSDNIDAYVYEVINEGPWEFYVSGLSAGTYTFHVRARDNDGGTTDSEKITVTLIYEDLPPPEDNAIPVYYITKGPYLVYENDPDAMTVMWEQTPDDAGVITWGPTESYGESGTGSVSDDGLYGKLYKYTITGLSPGEKVYYNVNVKGQSVKSFFYATRTDVNETVTLYVGGDSRTAPDNPGHILTERAFSQMITDIDQNIDDRNSMILFTGDMVNVGNSERDWQTWFRPEEVSDRDFDATPSIYEFLTRMPIMNAIGNHELYANNKDNLDWTASVYRKYFPYNFANTTFDQANGLYYTFTYGPVRVLILDNERPITEGDVQYNWIENILENNTHPFVIPVYHRMAYGVGYNYNDWSWMQTDVVPLLQAHGVKMAFNGHDHFYNRSVVDGFHHVTTGGMTQLRDPGSADHSVKSAKELHFGRIEANPSTKTITVSIITDSGDIIETFTVNYDDATNINSVAVDNVSIYPNPVYDKSISVEFGLETLSKVSLSVLNMNGSIVSKPISNRSFEPGAHKLDVPMVNIQPGIYFMQITFDGNTQTHKIIVN